MMSPLLIKLLEIMPKKVRVALVRKGVRGYIKKYADLEVNGLENIDNAKGPIIFICNHLSNADALILHELLKDSDPYFVAGVKLTTDPVTNFGMEMVKTINIKPNSADKEAMTNIVKTVKEGNNLFIFPEGTRSRTGAMIEARKGILLIVRLTKATVIPIGISGTEKVLPIRQDGDMGGERWQQGRVKVNIGTAVSLPAKEKDEAKHDYEDRCLTTLMKSIAKLLPESYRGVYGEER
ncbi:lysophospholipid acyltransferase family protein [Inconstantimicrobium mannanitabidum]|uniref:1-acyl-sn-glycerol-3-phosphate acyltransferase n=1 Tax=Inconstantimicrobium mannanitabidum TaxID=1604901 RepID=A0ACB5RF58_9CLOT|nr:lysophospholipid acyltransferase family protein [Clostridium sp. TW13]GKX67738.1 1-acyl-sn-glycerol-3-phosphate acyltransferase [Clostridium sp. TW13]